jgi:hypothetical protein
MHKIESFTANVSKPFTGQTLILARGNSKSGTKSVCVSAPIISDIEILERIRDFLPTVKKHIAETRSEILAENRDKSHISTEALSLESIISRQNLEFSAEFFTRWFSDKRDEFTVFACMVFKWDVENLSEEQNKKIDIWRAQFQDVLIKAYGGKSPYLPEKARNQIKKFLTFDEESFIDPASKLILAQIERDELEDSKSAIALGIPADF